MPDTPRPRVQGHCPACGGESLFVASGGYITCSRSDCPDPTALADILEERETHHLVTFKADGWTCRHPLIERKGNQLVECEVNSLLQTLMGPPPVLGTYRLRTDGPSWERIDG